MLSFCCVRVCMLIKTYFIEVSVFENEALTLRCIDSRCVERAGLDKNFKVNLTRIPVTYYKNNLEDNLGKT